MIIGVVGSGLMGSGIAQAAATAGYRTIVCDSDSVQIEKGRAGIQKSLARLVEKGKLTAVDQATALKWLTFTTELEAVAAADFIIEAVTEDLALKNKLWGELDRRARPETIFASNTSSLSIISMATATTRPDRFVGLHFFNPVPLMPLVEVVRTVATSSREGCFRVHREPAAGAVYPGCDSGAGAWGRFDRRYRHRDAARSGASNGTSGSC